MRAVLRGSIRRRSAALGRGAFDQLDDGALRRKFSLVKGRALLDGMRGDALLRMRASLVPENAWRENAGDAICAPESRVAAADGKVRDRGRACCGTRAADMAGPRGVAEGAMAAGLTPGAEDVCTLGCAGAWYGVG